MRKSKRTTDEALKKLRVFDWGEIFFGLWITAGFIALLLLLTG